MAKWRKKESLGKALAREGMGIVSGVARGLLSIATLGMAQPRKAKFRYPQPRRKR